MLKTNTTALRYKELFKKILGKQKDFVHFRSTQNEKPIHSQKFFENILKSFRVQQNYIYAKTDFFPKLYY